MPKEDYGAATTKAPVLTPILFLQIFRFLPIELSKAYPESPAYRRKRGAGRQVYANKSTGVGGGGEAAGPGLPFPSLPPAEAGQGSAFPLGSLPKGNKMRWNAGWK